MLDKEYLKQEYKIEQSVLNVAVSVFPPTKTGHGSRPFLSDGGEQWPVSLMSLLIDQPPHDLAAKQKLVRAGILEKKFIHCFTPSGVFEPTREAENLVDHTGLIAFDIDAKDNASRLRNYDRLQHEVSKIPYTAYCGKSVSGLGLWGLFAIPKETARENHKATFDAMLEDFAGMGVIIDKGCSDLTRARYLSHDRDAYLNHAPQLYTRLYVAPPPAPPVKKAIGTRANDGKKTPWQAFNENHTCEEVLTAFGFKIDRQTSKATHYTRPGKQGGTSVTVYHDNGKTKNWSTSVNIPGVGEHTPFALFAWLKHQGDIKKAVRDLKS
jgi:hypothetical protein